MESDGYTMNADYADRWISIEEAAEYLGVSKDTIRNWIKKNQTIPAHKIGKQWRFKRTELDLWVKEGNSCLGGRNHFVQGAPENEQ